MPICTKCFIDKVIEEFPLDKQPNKVYRKKYCIECFRKQSREWKLRNKDKKEKVKELPQPEKIIKPEVPESQPEVLIVPDRYKICTTCNEIKPHVDFYISSKGNVSKNCRECTHEKYRTTTRENIKNNGGSERVCNQPNKYVDEEQKKQTFWVMELMGWKYNDNGVWSKDGFKDKDKNWYLFKETKKKVVRRTNDNTGRKFAEVYKHTDELIKKYYDGVNMYELAYIYKCSHTTIRKIIKEYRDGKRSH
jgi:hypothetical protein